jgi:4a-hydroxytetrahydrobiopterin dehydratase
VEVLAGDELVLALGAAGAQRWEVESARLRQNYAFTDFSQAWAFLTRVALLAERYDHHPDLAISWNRVSVELTTHDAGGLTQRDVDLAAAIDAITDPAAVDD